jgi:predicted transcriptional regulator
MEQETTEVNTQKRIYLLISQEPGLHINKIAQLCEISQPLTWYHIRYLEKHELISVDTDSGFSRCYPKGAFGVEDKKRFSVLRQRLCAQIVLFLLKNPNARHKEIHEHFSIAKSTLSYHLKKLVHRGIIMMYDSNGDQRYSVVDEQGIISFLMKYEPLGIAAGLNETFEGFTVHDK